MKYVDTEQLKSDISSAVDDASSKLSSQYAKMGEKASAAKEKTKRYIHENPENSVLIAAGVGAAIGALFVLKMMSKR
ncbi:MAG TPA: hypothetical protein VK254_00315 [Candidatus Bathyarchaeia archaeon]|nr:hypothetical protein [Candidatus Bathyarchaeia archaeon]